jgi:hypothetical protein
MLMKTLELEPWQANEPAEKIGFIWRETASDAKGE